MMKRCSSFAIAVATPAVARFAAFLLVLTSFAGAVAPAHAAETFTLMIQNNSKYSISRLYVASSADEQWGPDQLGEHTVKPGTSFSLTNLPPGEYDIQFADEHGNSCILKSIGVFKNISWSLTTDWLETCASRSQNGSDIPDLTGTWVGYYANGSKSEYVWAIGQSGSTLFIQDAGGTTAKTRGRIDGYDIFVQDFATQRGTLSADGMRITWTDGVVWVRQ